MEEDRPIRGLLVRVGGEEASNPGQSEEVQERTLGEKAGQTREEGEKRGVSAVRRRFCCSWSLMDSLGQEGGQGRGLLN